MPLKTRKKTQIIEYRDISSLSRELLLPNFYNKLLQILNTNKLLSEDIDKMTTAFSTCFKEVMDINAPIVKKSARKTLSPWMRYDEIISRKKS